jgi:phosphohistidine phosphatase SixA
MRRTHRGAGEVTSQTSVSEPTEHMNDGPQHFVILVRHASREKRWDLPESEHRMANWKKGGRSRGSNFNAKGLRRTLALAGRLCDELQNVSNELQNDTIRVTDVIYSGHTVAKHTAEAYVAVFKERSEDEGRSRLVVESAPGPFNQLNPEEFVLEDVVREIIAFKEREPDEGSILAFIVIGHQPQLTLIARKLLKRWPLKLLSRSALPGDSLPIEDSEAACIRLGYGPLQWHRPRLLWLITAKPEDLLKELKDKIKSKYDVAKFFLGAFIVNTGLLLSTGIWGSIDFGDTSQLMVSLLAAFGIIMALTSLAFTAATLFSYDSLLMPESLWSEAGEGWWRRLRGSGRRPPKWSVLRPPSQVHVILFYEMMHVWKCCFVPAVILAFISIVSLVSALALEGVKAPLPDSLLDSSTFWWALPRVLLLSTVLAFLISWWLYRRWRPRLGTED